MTWQLRESLAHHGTRRVAVRCGLTVVALVLLVMPALDLGWLEPKVAEGSGARCPLHANPVVVGCPAALDVSQAFEPGEVLGQLLRPQLLDASIFIPPKL